MHPLPMLALVFRACSMISLLLGWLLLRFCQIDRFPLVIRISLIPTRRQIHSREQVFLANLCARVGGCGSLPHWSVLLPLISWRDMQLA